MTAHRIKRVTLELAAPDVPRARAWSDRCSALFAARVAPLLDRAFSRRSDHIRIDRIDRLELDLGTVDPDDDDELLRRLADVLDAALARAIRPDPDDRAAAPLEILALFARTGNLPWFADRAPDCVTVALTTALSHAPHALLDLLHTLADDPPALARLARHCPAPLLAALLERCFPDQAAHVAAVQRALDAASHAEPTARTTLHRAVVTAIASRGPALHTLAADLTPAPPRAPVTTNTDPNPSLLPTRAATAPLHRPAPGDGAPPRSPTKATSPPMRRRPGASTVDPATPAPTANLNTKDRPAHPIIILKDPPPPPIILIKDPPAYRIMGDTPATPRRATTKIRRVDPRSRHRELPTRTWRAVRAPAERSAAPSIAPHISAPGQVPPPAPPLDRPPEPSPAPRVRSSPPQPADRHQALRQRMLAEQGELHLEDGGLVLLWPFLDRFLQRVGLIDRGEFLGDEARAQAVALLAHVAIGDPDPPEFALPLAKLLCGHPLAAPVPRDGPIPPAHIAEAEHLLEAVIDHVPPLNAMTTATFRAAFLVRPAVVHTRDGAWTLQVERHTHDVLLDRFPWAWSWVKLPWMPDPLRVEW